MKTIIANGVAIACEITGSGPPVLLIHSGESDHRLFDYVVPGLAEHFTVVRYDQRDAGHTPDAKSFYAMSDLADDAAALLNALGLSKAHVFGTAFGGMLAQDLASRHPQLVDRLILAGSALRGTANDRARAKLATYLSTALKNDAPELRRAAELFYYTDSPSFSAELIDSLLASRLLRDDDKRARRMHAVKSFNGIESSLHIRVPTLVLTAREDQLIAPLESWELAQTIPRATLLMLSELGHHFYRQAPALTVRMVTEFLLGRTDNA